MQLNKLNRKEFAYIAGVNVRTVNRWAKDGLPRRSDGKYDARECVRWLIDRSIENSGTAGPENEESAEWLAKYRRERFKITRIERLRMEGELMDKNKVSEAWAKRLSNLAHSLNNLVDRLPPILEGKSRSEIGSILKTEIWVFRMAYSQKARLQKPRDHRQGN